ncbi:MAG: hypothetical protein ACREDP_24985, partial [Bradyrhizobium sp.]
MLSKLVLIALFGAISLAIPAQAQSVVDPAVTACKSTGLIALKQHAPDIDDLILDMDSLAVSAAETKVEDVAIKTVILGEAYIKRNGETGKADRFVCLIGDKGKV